MKRFFLILITLGIILWAGGYIFYRFYFPDLVAQALLSGETPAYVPRRLMNKVDELRAPINKGVDEIVVQIKLKEIPLEDVIDVIDNTSGDDASALLSELNESDPSTPDEVFDIAKKYIHADFDVEIFRKAFTQNVPMSSIRKAMSYANTNNVTKDLDIETGRAIAKQILTEKYQQVNP